MSRSEPFNDAFAHPYSGRSAVLTSKHQKLNQIGPAFAEHVGLHIIELALDTDQLGTFTGEIERMDPPKETAIRKARMGITATGSTLGIASEGSIGPDPLVPFIISDIEHLVLVDDELGIVISETYRSFDITTATITAAPGQDLSDFLIKADFPNHKLIVRPNTEARNNSVKGITALAELITAIEACAKESPNGFVVIESDLRAHCSPSRRANIQMAAEALALRVSQLCPRCQAPGWGRVSYKKGVRCADCLRITPEALAQEILGCARCDYSESGKIIAQEVDPTYCTWCNP